MFADLGHFTASSIRVSPTQYTIDIGFFFFNDNQFIINHLYMYYVQLAFGFVVYPCLVVQYMGQAAYLSKNISSIPDSFYKSIPGD